MMKEKRTVKKKTVLFALALSAAAVNFIALAFTVVRGEIEYLTGAEVFYANGFTLAFDGYPVIVEGMGWWLRCCSVIHFALSLAVLLAIGVRTLVKRSTDCGAVGTVSVIVSLVMTLVYMINGIAAYSTAGNYADIYFNCSTASFWPFIFTALIAAVYFSVRIKLPEKIEL